MASNVMPWQALAGRCGGALRVVQRPDPATAPRAFACFDWTDAVEAALDDSIGLVALPACHWTDGSLLDLERIARACQAVREG